MALDLRRQFRRFRRIERREFDDGHPVFGPQLPDQGRERMVGRRLLTAGRAENEDGAARLKAQQEMQPLQRLLVTPLQVVDPQQQRRRRGEHAARQRFEKALAPPVLGDGLGPGERRVFGEELGQQAGDLGQPDRVEGGQVRTQGPAPQPFGNGRER